MTGNVEEWCWDWYKDKTDENTNILKKLQNSFMNCAKNPTGPSSGESRVARGGCYDYSEDYLLNVSHSTSFTMDNHIDSLGFRVCRSYSK